MTERNHTLQLGGWLTFAMVSAADAFTTDSLWAAVVSFAACDAARQRADRQQGGQ